MGMINTLEIFGSVMVLCRSNIQNFSTDRIITASENVSRQVVAKYFPDAEVFYDTVFLRYDEGNVKSMKPVGYDRESALAFDRSMMELAANEAEKSSDWWRHVGAVLVKDGVVLTTSFNHAVPSEMMSYVLGNPRDFIEAGKMSHFSDVLHSEKKVLAFALRQGVSTTGADIYVSVFPCPDCAKMIAYSGIKRCFFGSGHASLDGQEVLRSQGVEMIYVPFQPRT